MQSFSYRRATIGVLILSALSMTIGASVTGVLLKQHPNLGSPVFSFGFLAIYSPLAMLRWSLQWGLRVPELIAAWIISALPLLLVPLSVVQRKMRAVYDDLEAQCLDPNDGWGGERELRDVGLIKDGQGFGDISGVPLGQLKNGKLITTDAKTHQIISAGTGGGKTSGNISVALASWQGSVVVSDPRKELYAIWSDHRSTMGPTFFIDPTHPDSARINPLQTEIRWGEAGELGDLENMVALLSKSRGLPLQTDAANYYDIGGREMIVAMALHAKHDAGASYNLSFGDILRALDRTHTEIANELITSRNRIVLRATNSFNASTPDKKQSILDVARKILGVFKDELIHSITSGESDFTCSDIFTSDKPISVFLQIRSSERDRLAPFVNLIEALLVFSAIHDEMRVRDGTPKKQDVLLICEEFPHQGRKDVIADNLKILRAHKMTVIIVTQSIKELEARYGTKQTIFSICETAIMSAAMDPDEQRFIADNCGTKRVRTRTVKKEYGHFGVAKRGETSVSSKVERKPVITPGEVRAIPMEEQIILMLGHEKAYKVKKPFWFKHPYFKTIGVDTHGARDVDCLQSAYILQKHHARIHP